MYSSNNFNHSKNKFVVIHAFFVLPYNTPKFAKVVPCKHRGVAALPIARRGNFSVPLQFVHARKGKRVLSFFRL